MPATDCRGIKLESLVSGRCVNVVVRMGCFVLGFRLAQWVTIFRFTLTYLFYFVIAVRCDRDGKMRNVNCWS